MTKICAFCGEKIESEYCIGNEDGLFHDMECAGSFANYKKAGLPVPNLNKKVIK